MLATIIGFSAFLVFRSLFKKSSELVHAGADGDVHDLLKKVLDQTSILEKALMSAPSAVMATMSAVTSSAGEASSGGVTGIDPAEIAKLKKLVVDRDEELNRLKNDPIAAKLRDQIAKVQELQSRLKEYEILEDDIADLSLYKEENARLKTELQNLVGSSAPPAEGVAADVVASAEAAPAGNDALVDQFAQVVDQTKGLEAVASTEGVSRLPPQTGDPMADFATAVKITAEAATASATAAATVAVTQPVAVAPTPEPSMATVTPITAATPAEAAPAAQANDLFAEFSSGSLDTDKVMEELVSLEKLPAADSKDALEGALDADKMVAEAAGFSKN